MPFDGLVHAPDWARCWEIAKITLPIHILAFGVWLFFALRRRQGRAVRLRQHRPVTAKPSDRPWAHHPPSTAPPAPPVPARVRKMFISTRRDPQGTLILFVEYLDDPKR
jgi:hypothetical protein